jgi:large conductance mechanosensitive channel
MSSEQLVNSQILEELQKIRVLLEAKPAPPPPPSKGLKQQFLDFISKYKVLGLAVAFIMALYLGNVVQALVRDLITPVIAIALQHSGAKVGLGIVVDGFQIGDFITQVITFLIVALVIFLIVKIAARWHIE